MLKGVWTYFVFALLFVACNNNKWKIDVSNISLETDIVRFDREIFELNHDSLAMEVPRLKDEYGTYFKLYNHGVINIGVSDAFDYADKLLYFITDPYIGEAYKQIKKTDFNIEFDKVKDGFKHYKYYFPKKQTPKVYTHVSGFNQSIVIDSGLVSISLDKYLGAESKFYAMLRTPMYLRSNMHKQKIPTDVLMAWVLTEFPYNEKNDNLANRMIYYGKIHTLLDAFLPNEADSLKWGYSQNKLNWCKENERQMWLYLIENKLLFSSNFKEIKRFTDDGPFTTPFSKESPSRTGRWLGYQIVNSYLKHNPQVSLQHLMEIQDHQLILNESKYKP